MRKHVCDKKQIEKEKIENFVVIKTMGFLKDDDIVNKLAQFLFDLQYEENTLLSRLESQVEEQKKVFEEQPTKERLTSLLFIKEQFKMSLCNLRKINTNTKEGKAKLIDHSSSVFMCLRPYQDNLQY